MKLTLQIALIFLFQLNLTGQVFSRIQANSSSVPGKKENSQASENNTDDIIKNYYVSVSSPNEIINGREYTMYNYRSKTTPLLFSGLGFRATLYFNNRKYNNIKLQYDTFLDEVIYTDTSKMVNFQFPRISLNDELIDGFSFYFNFETYNFRHLRFPANPNNSLTDGFYEIVYEGPSMLIIKHRSLQYIKDGVNEYEYSPEKYVYLGGTFRKLTNMKDFALMFGQRMEEIKEYLHKKKIKIRKAGKMDIAGILKYYDSLTQ